MVHVVMSLVLSPGFPWTDVPMFADIAGYREGWVPRTLADGQLVETSDFVDFEGIDLDALRLGPGMPCSLGYVADENVWWVAGHGWSGAGPQPEVELTFALDHFVSDNQGVRRVERRVVATGRARPR